MTGLVRVPRPSISTVDLVAVLQQHLRIAEDADARRACRWR